MRQEVEALQKLLNAVQAYDRKEKPFTAACKDESIDYLRARAVLNSRTFRGMVIDTPMRELRDFYDCKDEFEKLYEQVFGEIEPDVILPPDYDDSMMEVLAKRTDREQDILHRRFGLCETLEEVAEHYQVTRERIRSIEKYALRKLRLPDNRKLLALGSAVYHLEKEKTAEMIVEAKKKAIAEIINRQEDAQKILISTPLHELELSVRAYNCLNRHGVKTLNDLLLMPDDELMNVRNLGKKSYIEVKDKIAELTGMIQS